MPGFVRLGLVLSLGMTLHVLGGLEAPALALGSPWELGLAVGREALLGVVLGLIAGLPFEAARMGGRFIDLFRGASAEANLPGAGTRESAMASGLYQLLLALVAAGPLFSLVTTALFRTFGVVKLGVFLPEGPLVLQLALLVTTALAAGLAVATPVAVTSLLMDGVLALASRAGTQLGLAEASGPLKVIAGAAVAWLTLGLVSSRLLEDVGHAAQQLQLHV